MKPSQLVLVLSGKEESPEVLSFCRSIKTLGFAPETYSLAVWRQTCANRPKHGALFWLDEERILGEVLESLPQDKAYPTVAILVNDAVGWEVSGLQNFTEIIRWPCERGELGFRLTKAVLDQQSALKDPLTANLIGRSLAFQEVIGFICKVAQIQASVLILGETGTGKEVVARAIHYRSLQRNRPFVPFNCGGVPAELLENELFGHEAGAFTSAQRKQTGLVAQAEGGSLFLDEIDALPLPAQAALLRFLQDRCYRPLGGGRLSQANVRILAASNSDLAALVKEGKFREDLWYRLNVLTVSLPPLRERQQDIPLLTNHFLRRFCQIYRRPVKEFSPRTLQRLMRYPWPGNVRELENWVHRAFLLGEESLPDEREPEVSTGSGFHVKKAEAVASFERDYLTELMQLTHGNVSQAAKIAGKERRCLGKLLKKHGISALRFRPSK